MPHERDLNDYILVFPADAGMEPIYVYLSEGKDLGSIVNDNIDNVTVSIPEHRTGHIFRNAKGHVPDTLDNRQLILDVANDKDSFLGSDRYGNNWLARTLPDGSQVWIQTRGDKVINAGINNPPKIYRSDTGLSSLKLRGSKNGK